MVYWVEILTFKRINKCGYLIFTDLAKVAQSSPTSGVYTGCMSFPLVRLPAVTNPGGNLARLLLWK